MDKRSFPSNGGVLVDPDGLATVSVPWSSPMPPFAPRSDVVNNLATADDIKDQLRLLVNEIRSLRSRQDEMDASSSMFCGFDSFFTLSERKKLLNSTTAFGRRPAKASALLVILILEALSDEPKTERSIKEYVVEQCRKSNVKVSTKGTITGSTLEVTSVCAILAGLGLVEFSPNPAVSSPIDSHVERAKAEQLANSLRARHDLVNVAVKEKQVASEPLSVSVLETEPAAPDTQTDECAASQVEEQETETAMDVERESSVASILPSAEDAGEREKPTETTAAEMEFEELDMDDALSLLAETDRDVAPHAPVEAEKTATAESDPSNTKKPNPVKLWRLVKEKELDKDRKVAQRNICIDTDSLLSDVSLAVYSSQRAQEMEEKLLRRLASQCRLVLPAQPLSLGTRYLDSLYEDVRSAAQPSASSSSSSAPAATSSVPAPESQTDHPFGDVFSVDQHVFDQHTPSRELFERPSTFTAQSLLHKVFAAKRQRGSSMALSQSAVIPPALSVAVFDVHPIEALQHLCDRIKDEMWRDVDKSTAIVEERESQKERTRKRTHSVTARDHEAVTLFEWLRTQPTLSATASTAQVISQQDDILLAGDAPSLSVSALKRYNAPLALLDAPSSTVAGHCYVDLSLDCEEIPWVTVAKEFIPIERDENEPDREKDKKQEKGEADHETENVEAPMFREIESIEEAIWQGKIKNDVRDEDLDEDISEEAMLARHENVLRGMREKWALLQRLKNESRSDGNLQGTSASKNDGERDPDADRDGPPAKKRGRPPKMQKLSSYNYTSRAMQ